MTKQELLKLYPQAIAAKDNNNEWHIWAIKGVQWLGFGNTETEAWCAACQEPIF